MVVSLGKKAAVADKLGTGRTPMQCARRHQQIEQNSGVRLDWSPYEDEMLRMAVSLHGTKDWRRIAASVPTRTAQQCLYRWTRVSRFF